MHGVGNRLAVISRVVGQQADSGSSSSAQERAQGGAAIAFPEDSSGQQERTADAIIQRGMHARRNLLGHPRSSQRHTSLHKGHFFQTSLNQTRQSTSGDVLPVVLQSDFTPAVTFSKLNR